MSSAADFPMPERLRDHRHQLILLGLVCLGIGSMALPAALLYAAIWYMCLHLHQPRRRFSNTGETILVATALAGAYIWGRNYSFNALIFVGNGLVLFQALYLLRPLNDREKSYTVSVAIVHMAIAAMMIVDWPFILALALMAILLPAALRSVAAAQMQRNCTVSSLRWRRDLPLLLLFMIAFFLLFPRVNLLRSAPSRFGRGPLQPELDMAATSAAAAQTLILQVTGEQLGYLKTITLDLVSDDNRWQASLWLHQPWRRLPRFDDSDAALSRRVRVVSPMLLSQFLPADGSIRSFNGALAFQPMLTNGGTVLLPERLRQPISYEYTSMPESLSMPLPEDFAPLLQLPPLSPRVHAWHAETVAGADSARQRALRLRDRLQNELQYELGAPELNRFAALDDFLFEQRRGHCERFAAALALLLRLDGTPSRIAIGFVPLEKNNLGNFYNIRAEHAHAWTEAWLPEHGWISLDATPSLDSAAAALPQFTTSFGQWLSYVWFGSIVGFSNIQQMSLLRELQRLLVQAMALLRRGAPVLLSSAALLLLLLGGRLWWRCRHNAAAARAGESQARRRQQTIVCGFYGSMLGELDKRGWQRQPAQTPWEFFALLQQQQAAPATIAQVAVITEVFCQVRYGNSVPEGEQLAAVDAALQQLRHSDQRSPEAQASSDR